MFCIYSNTPQLRCVCVCVCTEAARPLSDGCSFIQHDAWALFSPSFLLFVSASERGGGQGDLQQQRQPSGPTEEAQEGPDGLHGPPAGPAGAQLRAAEVPERPGPHGAGGLPQPHRHAGQDLVPEPEVGSHAGGREEGGRRVIWCGSLRNNGHRDAMFSFQRPERDTSSPLFELLIRLTVIFSNY